MPDIFISEELDTLARLIARHEELERWLTRLESLPESERLPEVERIVSLVLEAGVHPKAAAVFRLLVNPKIIRAVRRKLDDHRES